jgi:hypothetical protein
MRHYSSCGEHPSPSASKRDAGWRHGNALSVVKSYPGLRYFISRKWLHFVDMYAERFLSFRTLQQKIHGTQHLQHKIRLVLKVLGPVNLLLHFSGLCRISGILKFCSCIGMNGVRRFLAVSTEHLLMDDRYETPVAC